MRQQIAKLKTGKTKRSLLLALGILLMAAILAMTYRVFMFETPFVPPEYEANARQGLPAPKDSLGFGSVTAPTGFSVGLCGTMYQQQDGSLMIYLTNPETNDVNIRCEIKNKDGTLLYESGVLTPNKFIERLYPVTKFKNEAMEIQVLIYGYEPDTWYSKGTIILENVLQPN